MYKRAALVLVLGVAVFYSAALTKMFLSQKTQPSVVTNPVVEPVPPPINSSVPRIDVVFAIDSTSSMGDEIEIVKNNIRSIISEISQGQPAPDVRYGIVTYRDRYDEYVTKSWPFTRDVQEISRALSSIVASGGGDKPEDVASGLQVTLHDMAWDPQAKSKIVFLIGDAGPHSYPDGYRWEDEIKFAQRNNISINTIACSGIWPAEEQTFSTMASSTNGQFSHLTYKQEVAKADGTHAVVIEEAGRSYELSKDAADKGWERGADELIARNEAKEIAAPPPSYSGSYGGSLGYSTSVDAKAKVSGATPSDELTSSAEDDVESGVVGGVVGGVAGGVSSGKVANLTVPSSKPSESIAKKETESTRALAKDSSAAKRVDIDASMARPGVAANMPIQSVGSKTNNLNSVLAGQIKQAARQQGAVYGTTITPAFDFKGTSSGVTTARKLFIDTKSQLQNLLGSSSSVDINKIDFNNQVVIAVFLGQVTNGTTVSISKISLSGNELVVTLNQQVGTSSSTTTPFHLVVIPRQIGTTKLDAKNIFVKFE
jgi:Mg-chelatase subunit ChlD